MTPFDFLNMNIESMRDQSPESNDLECVTKILSCGYLLLYLGAAADNHYANNDFILARYSFAAETYNHP